MAGKNTFADSLVQYQSNVVPSFLETLAGQLRVSAASLTAIGLGYALRIPLDKGGEFRNAWVIPERDEHGDIVGLGLRLWNGTKRMVPGSKRGLIYVPTEPSRGQTYQAGPQNWQRCTVTYPCPICNKPDWCMVSSENPSDPQAVLCCRIKHGAERNLGVAGYLHIRKEAGRVKSLGSALPLSDDPVLIVEGMSDVAAAHDLSFVAIGRPSAQHFKFSPLVSLISGRPVIVMGENDAGAGKEGMETTYAALESAAGSIHRLMPPQGIKDLRSWLIAGITKDRLLHAASEQPPQPTKTLFASTAPMDIARGWLESKYKRGGLYTLRILNGIWYAYNGLCYEEISTDALKNSLYQFLDGKQYKKIRPNGFDVLPYEPNKYKLVEILDALLAFCHVQDETIPCWLSNGYSAKPEHIMTFPNGWLDIDSYLTGRKELNPLTPNLFALSSFPYSFTTHADCPRWRGFLDELFDDDPNKIELLQEWMGYNLIPDNSHEKFMLLLGPTRAGKGTILSVMTYLLGDQQILATTFRDYTRRFGLYPFIGKLAAVIGDVSAGLNYDSVEALNILKTITGNDPVTIERKGKDITQNCVRLYSRFTMAANAMPQFPDFSRTVESRILVLRFHKSFMGKEDVTLKTRLKTEASGILLWALEGLRRLQKNNEFTLPIGYAEYLEGLRRETTPLAEFVSICCDFDKEYMLPVVDLFRSWVQWCFKHGEKHYTSSWFKRSFLALFPECEETRDDLDNVRTRVIKGVQLSKTALVEYAP